MARPNEDPANPYHTVAVVVADIEYDKLSKQKCCVLCKSSSQALRSPSLLVLECAFACVYKAHYFYRILAAATAATWQ